jgi:hypothetical protein
VSYRSLERRVGRGALGVYVNPLVVFGRVGEIVDARLGDFKPIARGDLLAHEASQFFDTFYGACGHIFSCSFD